MPLLVTASVAIFTLVASVALFTLGASVVLIFPHLLLPPMLSMPPLLSLIVSFITSIALVASVGYASYNFFCESIDFIVVLTVNSTLLLIFPSLPPLLSLPLFAFAAYGVLEKVLTLLWQKQ